MKSVGYGVHLGSVNLKGKKVKRLRCGCCTAYDLRENELEKLHKREINDSYSGYDCCNDGDGDECIC